MKSKLIYIITAVSMLGICIGVNRLDMGKNAARVHQHLADEWQEAKSENNEGFHTKLPIVSIITGGQKVPGKPITENDHIVGYEAAEGGKTMITVSFSVIDQQKGCNFRTDKPTLSSLAMPSPQLQSRASTSFLPPMGLFYKGRIKAIEYSPSQGLIIT